MKYLTLKPLHISWDNHTREISWTSASDHMSATAELPFGTCHWLMKQDDDSEYFQRVEVEFIITKSVRLHHLEVGYQTRFEQTRQVFTPYLRPGKDLVIADQIFRSPFLYVSGGDGATALIPDLLAFSTKEKTYLDFKQDGDHGNMRLAHAFGSWKPSGHIFFKRSKASTITPAGTRMKLCHFIYSGDEKDEDSFARILSFVWKRSAKKNTVRPQVLAFDQYDKRAIKRIFSPDLYGRLKIEGRPVAAMITQTLTAKRQPAIMSAKGVEAYLSNQKQIAKALGLIQSKVFTHSVGYKLLTRVLHSGLLKIVPMAMFQPWFNQARTALGCALYAQRIGSSQILRDASLIIELALAAPMDEGCMPSVCLFPGGRIKWVRGTRAFELIDQFHLPDAAVTGFHLLEWHQHIQPDPRIIDRCEKLARFFIDLQDQDGAFPAWVRPKDGKWAVEDDLVQSASSAAPAMMLARLSRIKNETQYFRAAERAIDFIEKFVMPKDRWFDFELLYSCAGRPTGKEGPDSFTGCYPMNTLSMYWAARTCLDLHAASGMQRHLDLARKIIARLSSFQQAFDNPRLSMDTFGGFSVMNADAEFNDARQGLFVSLYQDMYQATGDSEYFERGVAALRACYTTMLTEENREVAPGNMLRFRPSDRGSVLENYGHTGHDEASAGYLSPDWGCGTSLYASGLALKNFGQVFVDVKEKIAFGTDRCTARFIKATEDLCQIEINDPDGKSLDIVLADNPGRNKKLLVNGQSASKVSGKKNRFRYRP